jgi:hypothetical protein
MSKTFGLIYLAALLVVVMVFLLYGHPDEAVKTMLIGLVVGLMSKIQTVFDFFFGSSAGSKEKDAIIAASTSPKPGEPT